MAEGALCQFAPGPAGSVARTDGCFPCRSGKIHAQDRLGLAGAVFAAGPKKMVPAQLQGCIYMSRMPKITIGMTCYNAADTVAAAIDSALAQYWPDTELLIVDDCSADSSVSVIENKI